MMVDVKKLSRTQIELFMECPLCFWLNHNKKVKRPTGPPFTINSAIDRMLKAEFDEHRKKKTPHPVMEKYKLAAIPFDHPQMDTWRANASGVKAIVEGMQIYGAIDDLWQDTDENGKVHVVDYKATGANEYHIYDSYRRQMEIYIWLLAQNGIKVSATGYFLFAKVDKKEGFAEGQLSFTLDIEKLLGKIDWVEEKVIKMIECVRSSIPPTWNPDCEYCEYVNNHNIHYKAALAAMK